MTTLHEQLGVWRLGIWLARKARFPVKLGGMATVLLVPLLVAAVLLVMRQHKDIQTTQAEVEGVLNIRPAMEVLSLVQKHRGQTNVLLSGIAYPGSVPGQILKAWRLGSIEVVLSPFILDELRRVLDLHEQDEAFKAGVGFQLWEQIENLAALGVAHAFQRVVARLEAFGPRAV